MNWRAAAAPLFLLALCLVATAILFTQRDAAFFLMLGADALATFIVLEAL